MISNEKDVIFEDVFKRVFRLAFIMGVDGHEEFKKLADEKQCMNRIECECQALEEITNNIILNHRDMFNFKIVKKI
jgi:hypothetical protein